MIGALIGIIFSIIILGVAFWAFNRLLPLIPLDEPFKTILNALLIVLGVVIVVWVCAQLLAIGGIDVPFFGRYR